MMSKSGGKRRAKKQSTLLDALSRPERNARRDSGEVKAEDTDPVVTELDPYEFVNTQSHSVTPKTTPKREDVTHTPGGNREGETSTASIKTPVSGRKSTTPKQKKTPMSDEERLALQEEEDLKVHLTNAPFSSVVPRLPSSRRKSWEAWGRGYPFPHGSKRAMAESLREHEKDERKRRCQKRDATIERVEVAQQQVLLSQIREKVSTVDAVIGKLYRAGQMTVEGSLQLHQSGGSVAGASEEAEPPEDPLTQIAENTVKPGTPTTTSESESETTMQATPPLCGSRVTPRSQTLKSVAVRKLKISSSKRTEGVSKLNMADKHRSGIITEISGTTSAIQTPSESASTKKGKLRIQRRAVPRPPDTAGKPTLDDHSETPPLSPEAVTQEFLQRGEHNELKTAEESELGSESKEREVLQMQSEEAMDSDQGEGHGDEMEIEQGLDANTDKEAEPREGDEPKQNEDLLQPLDRDGVKDDCTVSTSITHTRKADHAVVVGEQSVGRIDDPCSRTDVEVVLPESTHNVISTTETTTAPVRRPNVPGVGVVPDTRTSVHQPITHTDTGQPAVPPSVETPKSVPRQKSSSAHHSLSLKRTRKRALTVPSGTVAQDSASREGKMPQMKQAKPAEPLQEQSDTDICFQPAAENEKTFSLGVDAEHTVTVPTSSSNAAAIQTLPEADGNDADVNPQKQRSSIRDQTLSKKMALKRSHRQPPRLSFKGNEASISASTPPVLHQQSKVALQSEDPSETKAQKRSLLSPSKEVLLRRPLKLILHRRQVPELSHKSTAPSLLRHHRHKPPPNLFAAAGTPPSEYTPQIIRCFDDYISQLRHAQSKVLHRIRWGSPVKAHSQQKMTTLDFSSGRSGAAVRRALQSAVSMTRSSPGDHRLSSSSSSRRDRAERRSARKANASPTVDKDQVTQPEGVMEESKSRPRIGRTPTRGNVSTRRRVLNENAVSSPMEEGGGRVNLTGDIEQLPTGENGNDTGITDEVSKEKELVVLQQHDSDSDFEPPRQEHRQPPRIPTPPPAASGTASTSPTPQFSLEPSQNHTVLLRDSSSEPSEAHRGDSSPLALNSSDENETLLYGGNPDGIGTPDGAKGKTRGTPSGSRLSQWLGRKQGVSSPALKHRDAGADKESTSTSKKRKRTRFLESDSEAGSEYSPDRAAQGVAKRQRKTMKADEQTSPRRPARNLVSHLLEHNSTGVGTLGDGLEDICSPSVESPPPRSPRQATLTFRGMTRGRRRKRDVTSKPGVAKTTTKDSVIDLTEDSQPANFSPESPPLSGPPSPQGGGKATARVVCPLCGKGFPASEIQDHAEDCQGSEGGEEEEEEVRSGGEKDSEHVESTPDHHGRRDDVKSKGSTSVMLRPRHAVHTQMHSIATHLEKKYAKPGGEASRGGPMELDTGDSGDDIQVMSGSEDSVMEEEYPLHYPTTDTVTREPGSSSHSSRGTSPADGPQLIPCEGGGYMVDPSTISRSPIRTFTRIRDLSPQEQARYRNQFTYGKSRRGGGSGGSATTPRGGSWGRTDFDELWPGQSPRIGSRGDSRGRGWRGRGGPWRAKGGRGRGRGSRGGASWKRKPGSSRPRKSHK